MRPFVAGDLPALVADDDLARADRRADAQPGQRDGDRVAVLTDWTSPALVDT
jgi:hypothetical protein